MAHAPRRRGTIATALLAPLLASLVVVGGGCEIGIGADVPAFECVQGPAVCPGTQVCDPTSHQCVASCTEANCSAGLECDPSSGLCMAAEASMGDDEASPGDSSTPTRDADASSIPDTSSPPAETGPAETGACRGITCPCSGAASCDSGICSDSLAVGAGLSAAAGNTNFCTQPCCTSTDCAAGTVCFASDQGGNYCVAPGWLQRSATLGLGIGGATCQTGRDCRSGLCNGTTCADTCCNTSDASECSSGTTCRFANFPGAASFDKGNVPWCGPGGNGQNGSTCDHDSDCESELCNGSAGCSNACRTTSDCGGGGSSCTYVVSTSGTAGVVAACLPGGGHSADGASCGDDTDCQSQFCDPTAKVCTDVCFANSDCNTIKSTWRCRPELVQLSTGGSYEVLLCGT
jgi:hypothetical protein